MIGGGPRSSTPEYVLLREAAERKAWLELVEESFGLRLCDELSEQEMEVLWERVTADNARYTSEDSIN